MARERSRLHDLYGIPRSDIRPEERPAIKVVGVGSVGTFCAVVLMIADVDDPKGRIEVHTES